MANQRQVQAERTRLRVLAVARKMFVDPGYASTSTTDIAEAAGVGTRGALYHHFKDKRALFAAVFEQVEKEMTDRITGRDIPGDNGFERLRTVISATIDASTDAPEIRRILLVDGPAVLGWESWREIAAEYGLGVLRDMVADGIDDGSIRALAPDATALLLLRSVDEAALYIAHSDEPRAARAEAGQALEALLDGLRMGTAS